MWSAILFMPNCTYRYLLINEPKCRSRIHVFHYVRSSNTEKTGCISSVNTWKSSVGRNHVRRLFWLPMGCMTRSSICESCLGSIFNTDREKAKRKHTSYLIWRMLCLNPYSEHITCMSKANTRISTLAVSHVKWLCRRISICHALNTYSFRWIKSCLWPTSGQLGCKLFVIIRNSSLVKVLILTIFYAVKW